MEDSLEIDVKRRRNGNSSSLPIFALFIMTRSVSHSRSFSNYRSLSQYSLSFSFNGLRFLNQDLFKFRILSLFLLKIDFRA